MTDEQVKFYFNHVYRWITLAPLGISFGALIDYANQRKLDDDLFMAMLDQMVASGIVKLEGDIYSRL